MKPPPDVVRRRLVASREGAEAPSLALPHSLRSRERGRSTFVNTRLDETRSLFPLPLPRSRLLPTSLDTGEG